MATGSEATSKPRLVAVGRHLLPCVSAADYLTLGERRWHSLHVRAQEMLEDARADPPERVRVLAEVYEKRDRVVSLAIQYSATLDGAMEVIDLALAKAKIDRGSLFETMTPDEILAASVQLCGCDPPAETKAAPK